MFSPCRADRLVGAGRLEQQIAVGQHDRLGVPGRPGGVDEGGRVLGGDASPAALDLVVLLLTHRLAALDELIPGERALGGDRGVEHDDLNARIGGQRLLPSGQMIGRLQRRQVQAASARRRT